MNKLIYILIMLCISTSCKKTAGTFEIQGKIINELNALGLEDCKVYLYSYPVGTNEELLTDSTISNQDGSYSFQFERAQIEKYKITFTKEGYFAGEKTVFFSELTLEEINILNFETNGKSWAGIRILNQNPQAGDHFRYIKQEGKTDCEACCPEEEQNFFGALDTTIYCINNANEPYSILYWVIGTPILDIASVNTTMADTTLIEITY
jgi:hypothetical protein